MDIEEAQKRVKLEQAHLKEALDALGKAAIDAHDEELRRSWYRKVELLEEMEAQ